MELSCYSFTCCAALHAEDAAVPTLFLRAHRERKERGQGITASTSDESLSGRKEENGERGFWWPPSLNTWVQVGRPMSVPTPKCDERSLLWICSE